MSVECPQCNQEIVVEDGKGYCEDCDIEVDLDYLFEKFGVHNENLDPKDILTAGEPHAFCSECEYADKPTVVPLNEEWLCLNCQSLHEQVTDCDWCGTFIAGHYENTYLSGCAWCEGMMGYRRDE